jgi:hypothetical protein
MMRDDTYLIIIEAVTEAIRRARGRHGRRRHLINARRALTTAKLREEDGYDFRLCA